MKATDPLTEQIIGAANEVHRAKGPGLLESSYEACLAHELNVRGHRCDRQVPVPLFSKGAAIDLAFRADLVVDDRVLVELKALEQGLPVHCARVLLYLRETGYEIGLLINFHVARLSPGVIRFINDRPHHSFSVFSAPSVLRTSVNPR